jgi:hypothetical protein
MIKPIRLKKVNQVAQQIRNIRNIREQLNINNNNTSYQPTGASSSAGLDARTLKVKSLFEMFGLTRLG